ncbi:EVE domain-containing protein [Candidatus Halocynthiibacter alkanivorans]|uniref:EVE domain-containing protein n=1 Tax=Candidatus Halocynthiibacter alkanivorans TaxID=2267619 RepID=UPI000DF44FD5|nr:EVE domain-containing protein [Candidatus Halocynthiibacter alkanivorans]
MEHKLWIAVVHLMQVEACRAGGFVAFSHGKETAVRKVTPGDRVAFYAPRDTFEGSPVQAFCGLATVTGDHVEQRPLPGTEHMPWVRDADFETVNPMPVRPLLEELSFVRDPQHWGMAFRRSLFEVSAEDFEIIENALRGTS